MTFSRQILIGLVSGILTGVFFGERASATAWVADGFVKLLQMMVLPYITVSIIASLGSLKPAELRTLGLRAAAVIGGLWLVALTFAFLVPLTFPSIQSASFFSSSLVERRQPFDFVALYVPANPFNALANNIVPAVVLFSIVLGSALVGVKDRERLLDVLHVAKDAIARATRLVTRLTPYGLFAIAANAAGTLDLEQLGRLQIYLVAYVVVALLVSLWVLPGLVAALTPIRARDILRESQDSLITAAIAGDLFIVLPALTEASRTIARSARSRQRRAGAADRSDRAGVVQFSAHRKTAVAELHPVRRLVRGRDRAGVGLSAAGARRAGEFFRQPHRGGAVPARPVPHSGGYVPAVSGDRRDQFACRIARRGGPHDHRGAARDVRDHRSLALAARAAAAIRRHHRWRSSSP